MVAGTNKVFCGTENGVCELTKDTVYVHPSAKQCSWTPSSGFSDLFEEVCTKTTSYSCVLRASDFNETPGGGLYLIYWNVYATSSKSYLTTYYWGVRTESLVERVGSAHEGQNYIYSLFYVSYVSSSYIYSSIIPGSTISSEDSKHYSTSYAESITFSLFQNYNGSLSASYFDSSSHGTLKLYKLKQ